MKRPVLIIASLVLALTFGQSARAHALQPGYLELQLMGGENWRVFWRKPAVKNKPMEISVELPENCDMQRPPEVEFDGSAWVAQWVTACVGGLEGGVISIPGLEATKTDVLIRYELTQGAGEARRLTPSQSSFVVPSEPGFLDVLGGYFTLGVDHILEGIDHLLFVFALLLLIPDRWRLLGAITAFTVAHSVTLAAATLGLIVLPGPPVEAVIALSIMFLASELLQRDGSGARLSERFPWIVAFSFGLLHGFGFAGALQEIGLPKSDVPLALLAFNLGVEAGQLLFIAAAVVAGAMLSRFIPIAIQSVRTSRSAGSICIAYLIGGVSAYWLIERVASF